MSKIAAVLTGDLIGSTKAGARNVDLAMACLAKTAQELAQWAEADTRFTRFRGDGWQIYLDFPGLALRGALLLTASLRATDLGIATRIAVGIGDVERVGMIDLADARGDAFTISGHTLDGMPRHHRLALAGWQHVPDWQVAFFDFVEWQSGRWSAPQAEAVALGLNPAARPLADMAAALGITRQALQARLSGAGHDALGRAMAAFEGYDYKVLTP